MSGNQRPRVFSAPPCSSSIGQEAVELCESAGLILDPWQAFVLEQSLGLTDAGKWSAFEIGLCVPRQNGKGSILEGRELAGLFLAGERLIIHSAHQFDTSLEAFRRLLFLVEDNPDFDRRVKRVTRSHGEEGIELRGGQRIRFRTRTKGGGRGFTSDCLILDEAMILPESAHGALLPTLSARPNPQVWYVGSAVDQKIHADGIVFSRARARGQADADPSLAWFEWSLDYDDPESIPPEVLEDPASHAAANPGLGIRIMPSHVENERMSMDPRTFAVERDNVGDWHDLDADGSVISVEQWASLADRGSEPVESFAFAFDVTPDRSSGSIARAGVRDDGLFHVEIIANERGTAWIVPELAALVAQHDGSSVIFDNVAAGASLQHELEDAGVIATSVNSGEHAQACGLFYDDVQQGTLKHPGAPEVANALRVAVKRPLGGGSSWAWDRKSSAIDISPLVAATLALWGTHTVHAAQPWATHW